MLMLRLAPAAFAQGEIVQVHQDFSTDPGWEWMNNRIEASNPPMIDQSFGWSATNHTGVRAGEIGGKIWRSRTPAYYAIPLGNPLSFKEPFSASGIVALMPGEKIGGAYIGFFNHERQEWRPWSSMAWRLGDYPRGAEIHLDFMTATWMASGVRLPEILPADGKPRRWRFDYDPNATIDTHGPAEKWLSTLLTPHRQKEDDLYVKARESEPKLTREFLREQLETLRFAGWAASSRMGDYDVWSKVSNPTDFKGALTFEIEGQSPYRVFLPKEFQGEPVVLDRFGIFNFQLYGRHWEFYDNESTGTSCEFYIGDLTVKGVKIDLSRDPGWEGVGNRVTFVDRDFHGRHSFGFSESNWAGKQIGEIGGTVWRNEAVDPLHAYYADDVGKLTLDDPISFSGTLAFIDGATDGDVNIGYFNKQQRMVELKGGNRDYPPDLAEKKGGRRNIHLGFDQRGSEIPGVLGLSIGGPTRIGFNLNAACKPTAQTARAVAGPVIHPDRKRRQISFDYDPKANNGAGRITAKLDDQTFTLDLTPDMRKAGATFDHFGISSMRQGGKWVTIYLDDLTYTARRAKDAAPERFEQKLTVVPYPEGGRRY